MGAEDLRSECNTRGLRLYFFKIDFIKSTIHSSAVKYCISIYNIQSNAPASFFCDIAVCSISLRVSASPQLG